MNDSYDWLKHYAASSEEEKGVSVHCAQSTNKRMVTRVMRPYKVIWGSKFILQPFEARLRSFAMVSSIGRTVFAYCSQNICSNGTRCDCSVHQYAQPHNS